MWLHFSEPISDIRHVAKSIEQIVTLYSKNFLLDDSEVWIRTRDQRYMWTLTDKSALVSINTTTHPGAIRITNGRIRMGGTFEQAQNDPDDIVYFEQLDDRYGVSVANSYTQIVNHSMDDESVKIIDQSESRQLENGQYSRDGISIIDLCHYRRNNFTYYSPDGSGETTATPPEGELWVKALEPGALSQFEKAHGIYSGSAFITAGLSKKKKEHYRKNYEQYTMELYPSYLNELVDLFINGYTRAAESIRRTYNQRLENLDIPDDEDAID